MALDRRGRMLLARNDVLHPQTIEMNGESGGDLFFFRRTLGGRRRRRGDREALFLFLDELVEVPPNDTFGDFSFLKQPLFVLYE